MPVQPQYVVPPQGNAYPPRYGYPPGQPVPPMPPMPLIRPVSPSGAPLAEFGDRLLARLIDGVILGGFTAIIIVPVYFVAIFSFLPTVTTVNGQTAEVPAADVASFLVRIFGLILFVLVLSIGFAYVYEVEMMYRSGQTIGKRVMKIRIIPLDPAAPLTRTLAVKRFLVLEGANLVTGLGLVDGLWQLWDKPFRQCLHDKWATTCVIKLNS